MKAKNIFRLIKASLYALLLIVFIYYIYKHQEAIISTLHKHYDVLLTLTLLSMVAILLQAINYLDLLGRLQEIRILGVYRMWAYANLVNYVAPFQPGLIVRAVYFKNLGINYSQTGQCSLRQCYISFIVGLFILAIVIPNNTNLLLYIKLLVIIGFLLGVITFFIKKSLLVKLICWSSISQFISGLFEKPTFKQVTMITLQYLIIGFAYYFVFTELGLDLTITYSLLLSSATVLTTLFSIFPNGIGIQEAFVGGMAYYLSDEVIKYLAIPLMLRISHIMSCVFILTLTSIFGFTIDLRDKL